MNFWDRFRVKFFFDLQSRGARTDPFRASAEMGMKMAEKWILASPGQWGKMAREMGEKWAENVPKMRFRTIFPIFRASFPISGLRPEMDLYEVQGIAIFDVFQRFLTCGHGSLFLGCPTICPLQG